MLNKLLIILITILMTTSVFAKNKTLVKRGKMGNYFPSMATSWKSLNDNTIELTVALGVNTDNVVASLQKWFKRSVVEKKGTKKVIITTKYSLEQILNRLTIIPIEKNNSDDIKIASKDIDPLKMMKEPNAKTKISLIDEEKSKNKNYFMGKVLNAEESFPSIKLKIRVTNAPKNDLGIKNGDIIEAEPFIKVEDGSPDTTDEATSENMGALFLQKNDRMDAIIQKNDKKELKLLKVQGR
jgi:hypothetical protein